MERKITINELQVRSQSLKASIGEDLSALTTELKELSPSNRLEFSSGKDEVSEDEHNELFNRWIAIHDGEYAPARKQRLTEIFTRLKEKAAEYPDFAHLLTDYLEDSDPDLRTVAHTIVKK